MRLSAFPKDGHKVTNSCLPTLIDRNAMNREEKALKKLETAQKAYNAHAAAIHANTVNASQTNMTQVA